MLKLDPTLTLNNVPPQHDNVPSQLFQNYYSAFFLARSFWHKGSFNAAQAFSFTSKLVFGYLHISGNS